jgi:hypothetical protein
VQVLLLGTGSEVHLCVDAYEQLKSEGIKARVVSMPSWELFEEQSQDYRESIISPDLAQRVLVEQASNPWLEEVCRIERADHRHENLLVVRAAEGPARKVWLYPPGRGKRGEGIARQVGERMRR